MSYQDSPSVDDIKSGFDARQKASEKKPVFKWIILALVVIAVLLGGINFLRSDTGARLMGTGTITGQVVDEKSNPLEAELFILGTEIETATDPEGVFTLSGVPAGDQSLIIGHQGAAHEYPVTVTAGETINLGQLEFVSTLIPEE